MLAIKYGFVIVLILNLIVSSCAQRRITSGDVVKADKRYVVYLIKAPVSPQKYDAWLCGGALVSPEFIVTSAACVEDVQHMYAIAGYKKYIPYEMMKLDPCTREKKKKVVFICVPKDYDLVYERLEKWSYIDIAVVKVESPFDLTDASYQGLCSYIPAIIAINYEFKYQEPGLDTLVLGWGHTEVWRSPNDGQNYNNEDLRYASALILDKKECKGGYEKFENMAEIIDKYMICTMQPGNLNDAGELIVKPRLKPEQLLQGCVTRAQRMRGMKGVPCYEPHLRENSYSYADEDEEMARLVIADDTRRNYLDITQPNFRRNGICQNDHGGPLVTWVGSQQLLIGVASVFKVNNESKCVGPYLYTSTQCNGAFLDCILNSNKDATRRDSCDAPPEKRGFDTFEKSISWIGHPDGPAENEVKRFHEGQLQRQQLRNQPLQYRPLRNQTLQYRPLRSQPNRNQPFQNQPLRSQPLRSQPIRSQPLRNQPLRSQQILDKAPVEDEDSSEQLFSALQMTERQLPERQLPERQLPPRQSPELRLWDPQFRTQQRLDQESVDQQLRDPQQRFPEQELRYQEQQSPMQQLPDQQLPEQQLPEQQLPGQQLPGQQLPGQEFPEQEFTAQQFLPQQLPEQRFPEQQLPEQQFPEPRFPEGQFPELLLPELLLREQQLSEKQLPEQQLPEQQLPEQQLPEQQFAEQQLPQQQLPEQQIQEKKIPVKQLPEQQLPEHTSEIQLPDLLAQLTRPGLGLRDQESNEQPGYNDRDETLDEIGPLF